MADRVTAALGQQVYVENIAGASGVLGTQAVARSAPDGYTFLFGSAGALSTNMFLFKTLPYDLDRDFTPVALVVQGNPFALTANPDTPIKTLSDLTAYAKAHPGKVSYAVDTSSGWAGIIGQLLNKRLDIDMVQIPYKSTSQALQDTATGTTQLMVSSAAAVDGYAKSGRLRMIAVTAGSRSAGLDDVPTIQETLPGFQFEGWFAVVGPKGVPAGIVLRLNREIGEFLQNDAAVRRLRSLGFAPAQVSTPEATAQFLRDERERWRQIIKELKIQPQ
jgi:tripartite-type tricarboxylate transporter receptor subunit TctC